MNRSPFTMDGIAVGGVNVAMMARAGMKAAIPVLFLHGIGSRASSFAPLFAAYPEGPQLLAWDAPGYGKSTPFDSEWPLADDFARRLAGVLEERDMPATLDLVGHSLGCLMAAAFTRANPQRVRKLVLMSPALGYGVARGGRMPDGVAARLRDLETLGAARMAAERAGRLVHEPENNPGAVAAVREAMASVSLPGYAQAVRMLASGDLLADLKFIKVPTLVLTGENDLVTPAEGAGRVRDTLTEQGCLVSYRCIPAAGHAVYLEQTAQVAEVLSAFLGRAP